MPPSNSIDRWRYPVSSNSSRAAQSSGSSPSTSRIPAGISVRARRMAGRNCRTNRTSPSEVTGRTAAAPGWRTTSKSWPSQDSTWTRISRPVKASLDDRGCTEAPSAGDGDGALGRGGPTGVRRSHELPEERVRPRGPGPELWMELPPHEERVVRELDDLDQSSVGREPREDLMVVGVDLVAVPMTLVHDLLPVGCRGPGPRHQVAGLCAQAHGPTEVGYVLLLGQEVDHRVEGRRVELRGVRALEATHVPRVLDDRALQAQAQAEERHTTLPRVMDRLELSLDAPPPEPARHYDAVDTRQHGAGVGLVELVRRHPRDVHLGTVVEPPVAQGLDHRQVGVSEVHVLPYDRDRHRVGRRVDPLDQRIPLGEIRLAVDPEMVGKLAVQPLFAKQRRNPVDRVGIRCGDHTGDRDVAQERDLLLQVAPDGPVRAAHDDIGLEAQRAQLLHRVLRRLGLQLPRGADERHERDVDERATVSPDLVPELPDGLQEREALDVADRAADLDDQ